MGIFSPSPGKGGMHTQMEAAHKRRLDDIDKRRRQEHEALEARQRKKREDLENRAR